jgi:hypothetical protein
MKRTLPIFSSLAAGLLLAGLLLYALSGLHLQPASAQGLPADEDPQVFQQLLADQAAQPAAAEAVNALSSVVYLPVQDNGSNGTVIVLYNPTATNQTVNVKGISTSGSIAVQANVLVPKNNKVYVVSDNLAANPPASWANFVLVNFTDFVPYGVVTLPPGIKMDAYVTFNGASDLIDPRLNQGALPLRLSTDPATVFLPSLNTAP